MPFKPHSHIFTPVACASTQLGCPPKSISHKDIWASGDSLSVTMTSAIPQFLPTGRVMGRKNTGAVSQWAVSSQIPFPALLLVVGKKTKLMSSISPHSNSPHILCCFHYQPLTEMPPIFLAFSDEIHGKRTRGLPQGTAFIFSALAWWFMSKISGHALGPDEVFPACFKIQGKKNSQMKSKELERTCSTRLSKCLKKINQLMYKYCFSPARPNLQVNPSPSESSAHTSVTQQ